MNRFVNALLVFLMVLSAAAVYDMKYEAELAAEKVANAERRMAQEQERISLLKAEWSVLTQPARLQDLIERHADILQLSPMTAEHIGTLADVPPKPAVIPESELPEGVKPEELPGRSAKVETPDVGDDLPEIR